jgi:hypothetical protein
LRRNALLDFDICGNAERGRGAGSAQKRPTRGFHGCASLELREVYAESRHETTVSCWVEGEAYFNAL